MERDAILERAKAQLLQLQTQTDADIAEIDKMLRGTASAVALATAPARAPRAAPALVKRGTPKKKRTMSAEGRAAIRAAQLKRWHGTATPAAGAADKTPAGNGKKGKRAA